MFILGWGNVLFGSDLIQQSQDDLRKVEDIFK